MIDFEIKGYFIEMLSEKIRGLISYFPSIRAENALECFKIKGFGPVKSFSLYCELQERLL